LPSLSEWEGFAMTEPQKICILPGCDKPAHKLKDFCCYAHRGAWKALRATEGRTGLRGSKNAKQNRALHTLKSQSVGHFTFARINSCIFRIDAANKRGVGWLMEVAWPGGARQRWIARVGDRASEPLPLDVAKRAATSMLRERVKSEPRDWIAELNQVAADEVDRVAIMQERKRWPLDLMGGARRGAWPLEGGDRHAILSVELAAPDSTGEAGEREAA
jgi:hypothetical protein